MAQATQQRVEGAGSETVHEHPSMTHTHDHYHVTHHHGGVVGEFQHRASWHTHDHNHLAMRHGHDYDRDTEDREHGKEAHVHDHSSPATSPG
jgi:hypothetical protein